MSPLPRGAAAALGFLTVLVAFRQGVDVIVVLSLIVLGVLAFGVLGAISCPARDD